MGNAVAGGLRLKKGKKNSGCPCEIADGAVTWESITGNPRFRSYVLRHLLDESFISSILENGEREHALIACGGVQYYEYTEESQRGILREKLEAWQRAAGAGVTTCDGLNSESAFGELQLARPLRAYGFLPTLQRRLAVLRELGAAVAEEHRSGCRPFHLRLRAPPPSSGGQEHVHLNLMMNSIALESLSSLASLATALRTLPSGQGHNHVDLIRAPFAMLAETLEEFPSQTLFKYWSPLPSEPEKRLSVDPETATASCSTSLARLAVTGGLHVGWKSSATSSTWQVALREPATELTSIQVQWRAGDPSTGTDQNAFPLALSIEASVDGGKGWHGITGGDGAVDVALAHKASPGSSQVRYPVSLLALRRKWDARREAHGRRSRDVIPAVTHIRLKMKGASSNRPGGALTIYDVAINAPDPSSSPSDVMTVLRQLQTFLLTQHSRDQGALQEYILRSLLGVCQASCSLEFELDLVRVYMDLEDADIPSLKEGICQDDSPRGVARGHVADRVGRKEGLRAFVSTLLSAACRAKRQACRQDREHVIRDAGFDPDLSSKWVVVSDGGQLVSSAADNGHSHSLLRQCLRRGTWSWELALERESNGDETTCVGVAVNPVTNSCYEDSHQMWMVRCYSGETYSNGGRRNRVTRKIHPMDSVRLTLNCEAGTLSLDVNGGDQGVIFSNVPAGVHPAVCFYGVAKSVRLVELKRIYGDSDSDESDGERGSDAESTAEPTQGWDEILSPSQHMVLPSKREDLSDLSEPYENGARSGDDVSHESPNKSRKRRAERHEEAVADMIHATTSDAPSSGLLASLANIAQWYVPHVLGGDRDGAQGGGNRASRALDCENLMHNVRESSPFVPAAPPVDHGRWSISGRRESPDAEPRHYASHNTFASNDLVDRAARQSSRLRSIMGRPFPARRMSTSVAGTGIAYRVFTGMESAERSWLMPPPASTEVVGAEMAATQARKGKPLSLEEPYIIQPTAAVFQKLYALLVRSLARLGSGGGNDRASTASSILSLLQIMRANFRRLVDAHIDPAEVGLLLDYGRCGVNATSEAREQDEAETLLPDIFRCLQGIMLQEHDAMLLRATVDTFTSGLPLLMPLVESRLHLLLGLVGHLQASGSGACDVPPRPSSASSASKKRDASDVSTQFPRERVTLLRDLLTHFARTESVLQLLTLFEEDEAERNAVSDLLELMLTSMADRACPSNFPSVLREWNDGGRLDVGRCSVGRHSTSGSQSHVAGNKASASNHRSHWDELVASGAGGTTLSFTLIDTCQQHLLCLVLERNRNLDNPHELLLCQYGRCLVQVCCRVLSVDRKLAGDQARDREDPWWQLVGVLLPPFLHGLCMCVDRPKIAEGMLPALVRLSEVLSRRINQIPLEATAASNADEILRQTQLTDPEEGLALAPSGWHPVRASFEVDKDSMTAFSISEDGQLYSALTSNNTCALLDVGVSQGKAAWEFLLEDDSPSDECSVFGIATKPPYSRCYNSSQSLWMRRAYNGVLYDRGRQLPPAQSMSKIHPGDVVRCEVDMDEGTLRFSCFVDVDLTCASVNGEKQSGGFDDVEGEVFPCAGSYRSGVTIRLLKMEVMGGIGVRRADNCLGAVGWDPTEISWAAAPCAKRARGGLFSIDKKAMEIKRMDAFHSLHQAWVPYPAAVSEGDTPSSGVAASTRNASEVGSDNRSTPTERPDSRGSDSKSEKEALVTPEDNACVGRLQVADAEAWEWVSVRATRGFSALEGKHAVEMEVTPVGTRRRRAAGSTQSTSTEDRNTLRRYPMAFGLCTGTIPSVDGPIGKLDGSWGWWTDGSLRAHGEVLIPTVIRNRVPVRWFNSASDMFVQAAREKLYGSDFLPLKPFDVLTMIIDTLEGTLRYVVNGVDAGIAFGPPGSGAACELPDGKAPFASGTDAVLFPSCSLTNDKQVVQLRPGGTLGTQLWPLSLDLHKTVASVVGRLCATLVAGTPQDEAEVALEPWLRSPLLSGGVHASEDILGESAWQSLGRRSWDKAWIAEQQGRLVRTRNFMTWEGKDRDTLSPDTASESAGAIRQGGQSRSLCDGEVRLIARILQAVRIPHGLVLWPDVPCVRLTAAIDGRDVSCQEGVLNVSKMGSQATSDEQVETESGSGSNFNDQTGLGELVLELRLPTMQAAIDDDSQPGGSLPVLTLRFEVLVGRVVAAKGSVELSDYLKASLSETSTRRDTLSLTGGGEIVYVVNVEREASLSTASTGEGEQLPQARTGARTTPAIGKIVSAKASRPQTNEEFLGARPTGARHKRFLDSISSWGALGGSNTSTSSSLSSVDRSIAETPPVGAAIAQTSVGSSGKPPSGSLEGTGSSFLYLVEWLGRSHPDPPFLRLALEKTNSYAFPPVEAPFLAALLKHGGLVDEAFQAVEALSTWNKDSDEGPPLPVPTRDMAKLWARVRQLRAFLRTQKQEYKISAAEVNPSQAGVENGSSADEPDGMPKVGQVAKDDEMEMPSEEKEHVGSTMEKEVSPPSGQAPSNHVDREAYPTSFDDLCRQMTERAKFLLELSPCTIQSPSATAEGTSVLMHHLAEELPDLPTPPPAKMQSRLLRWRSEDHGKERWKGVVDVLRARSQLRRTLSVTYRPRARSLGNRPAETSLHADSLERSLFNPCIEEGQASTGYDSSQDGDPLRSHTGSAAQVDGESSGDDSDHSGNEPLLDNETATSAAIQACAIYIMTGGAVAPPRALRASLRRRTRRAAMRAFGLQALAALLRTLSPEMQVATSIGASSAMQEALVFLRPAFQGLRVKRDKEGREVEVTCDERDTRHHYLKGLEGCSADLLARVQAAFEDLYSLLRTSLDYSLRTEQPGLAHVLLTSWALDFESRDYRFLAHESGILPTLQAMVTLTNTASFANVGPGHARDTSPGPRKAATKEGASVVAFESWIPWSLDNIREGYMQGTLMAHDLASHVSRIPRTALPSGFLEEAELHGSASDILRRHSMTSLMRRYSALLRVHLTYAKARLTKADQEAALKRKYLEEAGRERVAQMVSRGVPVLDDREGKRSPEVQLTALCSWATVPVVASVACTFARGVTYACTPAGESAVDRAPSTNSGNYFEVTVMNPGEKTTIGVGLADPDVFPATKQMPGWVDHSYGYHGDDGRKFGREKTESIWPTWVDGDVIGCGFDADRRSIWYTRNGEMLGDGFVPVYESNLVPVVGFHSNGESVRVNFGLVPFAYQGPEVVIAPAVLAERELLKREARDRTVAESKSVVNPHDETVAEEKTEGGLEEKKEAHTWNDSVGNGGQMGEDSERILGEHVPKEATPKMMAASMRVLQLGASSLLRFLVAVSMRQASLGGSEVQSEAVERGLQGRDEAPSPSGEAEQARRGQARSSLQAEGVAEVVPRAPIRERSTYGTPLKQTQMHVDSLHQDIFDLILRELRLGALTLEHIASTASCRTEASGPAKEAGDSSDGDPKAAIADKLLAVGQKAKQEMKRSFSHGHSAARNSLAWKGLDEADRFETEREGASAKTLGLSALEIGEVEPHMFGQLALLCSVRPYAVVRTQMAHPSALRSIFSLLKVGSPRMQRCVLVLLGAVLPGMEPSAVDHHLPPSWMGDGQTDPPNSSMRSVPRLSKDHENERERGGCGRPLDPSDGLVGVLFSTVRHAYSVASSMPGSAPLENAKPADLCSAKCQEQEQHRLVPGCEHGFGSGTLELRLADQCSSLLRDLYKEPAWKELIARTLLLSIRSAASAIRTCSSTPDAAEARAGSPGIALTGKTLTDVISDAVAALAIIAGGSGVLYPGARVQSKSGVRGTVVLFSVGDAEAGVVFDGENVESCEKVLVRDLHAAGVGFRADPDTPAQPVLAQLLSLLGALLNSDKVSQALKTAASDVMTRDEGASVWLRVMSQSLMAVLQLSVHCSDAVIAACQDGDVVAHILPQLREVAVCPIQVPALITAQDFEVRWRSAQARMLSALRLGDDGLRTLQPIRRHPLPPYITSTTTEEAEEKSAATRSPHTHSTGGRRHALSAEEAREEALALVHPRRHGHAGYTDFFLEVARPARSGGGRVMALGDPHRSWGRGMGAGISARRAAGARRALDWMERVTRDEDDSRREGSRRRLMRSMAARGRRATSAESRLDPRWPTTRSFHDYDRTEDPAEYRDDESGALLVEFNDCADGEAEGREISGAEAGSAGSADSGDTRQDVDEMENNSRNTERSGDADVERSLRLASAGAPCFVSREGRDLTTLHESNLQAATSRPTPSALGFPITHLLDFGAEARDERRSLSARLSAEVGVPVSIALAALEAFGVDIVRARRWLQTSQHAHQVPMDEHHVSVNAPTSAALAGECGMVDIGSNAANGTSDVAMEESYTSIVSGLIGTPDDAGPARSSGEAASVPSAEEGLNLWESEEKVRDATAPYVTLATQCAGLLCEHDLVPVLGLPRPAVEVGGTTGTAVTTSCLVREVDLLVPGSLLVVTAGEGYAPSEPCPCVTVAGELNNYVELGRASGNVVQHGLVKSPACLEANRLPPSHELASSVMDNEEVLVEMMDAETGLCLGKRVPLGDLRHSTSFFGRELDDDGTTVKQILIDTDKALSILRARSLVVRLIQSLPTPAIEAAGGPSGLLNITRLLAAQELARGSPPVSFGILPRGGEIETDQTSAGSVRGDQQAEPVDPKRDRKLTDTQSSEQDSLLKMLWRKLMDSTGQWISGQGQRSGSAGLGEMLAQEVLDSFNTLASTSQSMLSGGRPSLGSVGARGSMLNTLGKGGIAASDEELLAESIVHESVHPLFTPLSYGGHIKVDPKCSGMVIKLDSRSRTSSDLLRLRFFSSQEDMLNERDPVRVMHGYAAERAARAKSKGMEFFKIEEADSTSYDPPTAASSGKGALPSRSPTRLTPPRPPLPSGPILGLRPPPPTPPPLPPPLPPLPPALSPQERASSVGSCASPEPPSSSRRYLLTSQEITRAMLEARSQVAEKLKTRAKEKPAPRTTTTGKSFRSFVLPGVHELWFRFDAPPGAEKPPLQIVALVGSLNFTPPGTVQASTCGTPTPDMGTSRDDDEDLSQEELGLQALFKCSGEDSFSEASVPTDGAGKTSKQEGVAERSSRSGSTARTQSGEALPGCLATAADVFLTGGQWYYEATVETLAGSTTGSEDTEQGLIRIGWACTDLPASLRGGNAGNGSRGSRAGRTCGAGAEQLAAAQSESVRGTGGLGGEGQTSAQLVEQTVGGLSGPLMRTVSWLSESAESSSSVQDDASDFADTSPPDVDVVPSQTGSADNTPVVINSDNSGRVAVETKPTSLTFPILGSDVKGLGVGLGQEGYVWQGGRPKRPKTSGFTAADVIGCAVDMDSGAAWFSVNGLWTGGNIGAQEGSVVLGWGRGGDSDIRTFVSPCLSVRGKSSVTVNFGDVPFKYPPRGQEFLPVILRDLPVTNQDVAAVADADVSLAGDKKVTFATQAAKQSVTTTASLPHDWGFRFVVDPLRGVHYRVVRELELICRFGGRARSGSAPTAAGTMSGPQNISIWRPKAPPGWFSVGDVASKGLAPPPGAVVVRADPTGCLVSKPAKFRVVHQDKATGFVVWRPVAREGQVSLGDFACAKKASKGIMAGAVRCIAAWAVEACPVVECLWREEKQSGTHAIWSSQNGLGTFFGSQTGGRMGRKEVTQGPHSRVERHKRKKKKKKKGSNASEESSEDDEGERVRLQPGVGEGWAMKGVSSSCITNEWCQESDVVSCPLTQSSFSVALAPSPIRRGPDGRNEPEDVTHDDLVQQPSSSASSSNDKERMAALDVVRPPQPSASWASWLLSFLLNHPHLRQLAMRAALFRSLVAYLCSPGAPHRLRVVPLLTLLVRSHAEFSEPPPLEELSGILARVLRECDKLTCGRGPRSSAWRSGDCPGGLQLDTSWASSGLLLLTDLAMATRRAQDTIWRRRAGILPSSQSPKALIGRPGQVGTEQQDGHEIPKLTHSKEKEERAGTGDVPGSTAAGGAVSEAGQVIISLPPYGTRIDEGLLEEESGCEEGPEDAQSGDPGFGDELRVGGRSSLAMASLCAEDRAQLEADLQRAMRPDLDIFPSRSTGPPGPENTPIVDTESNTPSRCLHHLLEIMDTVRALRDGWPSRPAAAANGLLYLDSILCEAWMDAVGPAVVVESEHPFIQGTHSETLRFPGAEGLVVFLDPRSSMEEGTASLTLEGKDKMISLTGQKEAPWSDIVTFRGDSITYRFLAGADGKVGASNSVVTDDPQVDDWGYRFTVVADGPVWECARLEGQFGAAEMAKAPGHEARIPGALSLLVELDQAHPVPPGCSLEVQGFSDEGAPIVAGLLTESSAHSMPIYVGGDKVRVVPLPTDSMSAGHLADSKGISDPSARISLANETKYSATHPPGELLRSPPPETAESVDLGAFPDADAKLERLPSNTPVLRAWGEATGVERRWRSASEAEDANGMAFHGASYVSNAATVEVADSDADSKDGGSSDSPSSGSRERARSLSRYSTTLDDAMATALPMLTAVSSDISDSARPARASIAVAVERSCHGVSPHDPDGLPQGVADRHGVGGEGGGRGERDGGGDGGASGAEGHGDGRDMDAIDTVNVSIPSACARAEGTTEERLGIWVVRVQAAALPRKARLHLFLQQRSSLPSWGPTLEEARDSMKIWTPEMDMSLLELLGAASTKSKDEEAPERVLDTLNPWYCRLTRQEAKFQHQCLAAVPAASLHIRAALLLRLNERIERVLPVIDLASEQPDSLGWQLREMNHLVLPHIKNAVLEAALAATQGPGDGVAVTLDNIKSMLSRDRGESDLASSQCVFAQAYRQLSDTDPKLLRTVWDGERVFQINFVGEDGVDAGGVFREGMSRMVEDLFSPDLDLLVQCPNGRHAVGQNNEKFVPNPQHSSPLALSMLRFVGRLMGLSLRTRLCLPFQLPGLIWKRMLGLQVGFEDLAMVDIIITQFITAIRTCEDDGLTSDEEFREMYGERLFFTYTGSDGAERELTPGGADRRVTFDNRLTFCHMVEHARTHEFDAQAAAMAAGLSDIVPMKVLRLFTAAQLEIAVAGEPEFDIAFWKEHTEYKGYRPDDETVKFFWKVIASMSSEDQSGFVRFAWGRSRLPPKAFWRVNMKLLRSNMGEESLPVSHTCFFSIELPPYTTEERMRKGLLTAVHFGMGGILNA